MVPTRCPASGPSGGRPRLVATRSRTAAAAPRARVRHGSASVAEVASRPTASNATAIEAETSCASRRTESVEVSRVTTSTAAATATWPTAPAPLPASVTAPTSSENVTGTTRTTVSAGRVADPPAHHPAAQRTARNAETTQPPPCATNGARAAAPSTMRTASSSLPQRRARCSPPSATAPARASPDRRGHPAVAAGHGHHVEVGRGRTRGDEGHRCGPDDAPVGASVGLCTAHAQRHQQAGQQGTGGDPRARPEPAVLGGQDEQHRHAGHRDERAGDRQHRGHRPLAAVPGHGGRGRRRRRHRCGPRRATRRPGRRRERSTGPAGEPPPRHQPGRARSGAGPGRCPRRTCGSWRRRSRTRAGRRRHAGSCPHHRARTRRGA